MQKPLHRGRVGDEPEVTLSLFNATARIVAASALALVANQPPLSAAPHESLVAEAIGRWGGL